jgi:hypothetical protein
MKGQSTSAADEQQLTHIGTRVLSVACTVPGCCRQHADLLVIADCFGCRASGSGELADSQGRFHCGFTPRAKIRGRSLHIPVAGGSRTPLDPERVPPRPCPAGANQRSA